MTYEIDLAVPNLEEKKRLWTFIYVTAYEEGNGKEKMQKAIKKKDSVTDSQPWPDHFSSPYVWFIHINWYYPGVIQSRYFLHLLDINVKPVEENASR